MSGVMRGVSGRLTYVSEELCGYHIPAGTSVVAMLVGVTQDDKHWTDPKAFNPDRFSGVSLLFSLLNSSIHPFFFLPLLFISSNHSFQTKRNKRPTIIPLLQCPSVLGIATALARSLPRKNTSSSSLHSRSITNS